MKPFFRTRSARYGVVARLRLPTTAYLLCALAAVGGAPLRAQKPVAPTSAAAPALFTAVQARRGEALYMENCAQCHRFDLAGGKLAPPLAGMAFTSRWTVRPLSDLFDYMRTEMPLNSPGGLSAGQNADLLAFLLTKSGYAAGQAELPTSSEKLAGVTLAPLPRAGEVRERRP